MVRASEPPMKVRLSAVRANFVRCFDMIHSHEMIPEVLYTAIEEIQYPRYQNYLELKWDSGRTPSAAR
jgi:hypothetical protein